MFRRLSFGLVALSSGLLACGSDPGNSPGKTDGGTVTDQPDPAHWGLADRTCFTFDDGSKQNYFNVAVMKDDNAVAGIPTYHLYFRQNGFHVREEWVEVRGDGLLLWRRTQPGDGLTVPSAFSIFSTPAPVYFAKDMRLQVPTISKASAKVSKGPNTETVAYTVTVTKDSDETIQALDVPQPASKLILTVTRDDDGSGTADRFWFVPNLGIVKYELDGSNTPVTLTKVEHNIELGACTP